MSEKTVFISYRRDAAGKGFARSLAQALTHRGYDAFLDVDSVEAGRWAEQISAQVPARAHFLLALTPGALDRCADEADWVRREYELAVQHGRNIVPVREESVDLASAREACPDCMAGVFDLQVASLGHGSFKRDVEILTLRYIPPHKAPPPAVAEVLSSGPQAADALPPIWNVPFRRNPNFSGRQRELERLEVALDSGEVVALDSGKAAALCQAIAGMGGVGKTQLAVEYAYRHRADYELVWWLRCEEAATLKGDYAALGDKLGLDPQQKLEAAVAQVREWLDRHSGWLLIFDNAQQPDDLQPYLPRADGGRVLITSRNRAWGTVARPFEVDLWSLEESVAFLEKRTGRSEPEAAAELAEELGRLPLALEQATAYIVETGQTLAGYLELYLEHHLEVLEKGQPGDRYEGTVATTWNLALEKVEALSSAASQLLALCSYLAPEEIPLDVLQEGRKHLPEPLQGALGEELALDEALRALLRFSLIGRTGGELSIHRLIQEVVRRQGEDGTDLRAAALAILADSMPREGYWDTRVWSSCDQLQPQALAVLEQAGKEPSPDAGRLWTALGSYAKGRADLREAQARFERALEINKAVYGPEHHEVAVTLSFLGLVLGDLGDLEGAKAHFERALAISEAEHRPGHPSVGMTVNNLGVALLRLGDLEGAKAHLERALAIDEAAYGPDHPKVATHVDNLGLVLQELGDLEGAKAHFERALANDAAAYGPDHPKVAIRLSKVGGVLAHLGDLEGAKAHLERALAIDEAAYGPDHPEVATDVNNLGSVLLNLGDLDGAKAHIERALASATESLGADHPSTQFYRENLEQLGRRVS